MAFAQVPEVAEKEGEMEYEIESIINHQILDDVTYYFVQWVGWPEGTWLMESELGGATDLLQEYQQRMDPPDKGFDEENVVLVVDSEDELLEVGS